MKKLLLAACCLWCVGAYAQTDARKVIEAYMAKDAASWSKVVDTRLADSKLHNEETLNYLYGLVAFYLSDEAKNDAKAEYYVEKASDLLSELKPTYGSTAWYKAYNSAFAAYKMGLNPAKVTQGLKCYKQAKAAFAADSSHYMACIEYGNVLYYLPAKLGGSTTKALYYFEKAETQMEKLQLVKDNWTYLNLLMTLADVHKSQGAKLMTASYYQKVLEVEPNYAWVRDELQPALWKRK